MEIWEYLHNQMFLEEELVRTVGWITRVPFGYLAERAVAMVRKLTHFSILFNYRIFGCGGTMAIGRGFLEVMLQTKMEIMAPKE
jgi:hypothetical protein